VSKKHIPNRDERGGAAKPARSTVVGARASLLPDVALARVAVTFVVIFLALQAAVWTLTLQGVFDPIMRGTAVLTGVCSNGTGVPAIVSGEQIFLTNRILRIDLDCTGISLAMVYAALVLAYPLNWRRKLVGLGVGIPALLLANLVRLIAVVQLSGPLEDWAFLFVPYYLFKVAMIAVVTGLWAAYLVCARRHAS